MPVDQRGRHALVLSGTTARAGRARAAARRYGRSGPVLLATAVALAACTSSSAPQRPSTARVERGVVSTAVTSSGALAASSEQNLGFRRGGRLTAVNVKVGDRVTAGQVLATVDDAAARRTLEQQQAQLDAQRAVLNRLTGSTAVAGAQNSAAQAQAVLAATEDQARATREADDVALKRAQKQLDFDEDAREDAEDRRNADRAACRGSTGGGTATSGTFSRSSLPGLSILGAPVVGPATGPEPGGHDATAEGGPTDPGTAGPGDPGADGTGAGDTRAPGAGDTGAAGTGGTGAAGTTDTGAFSALSVPVDPAGSGACNRLPNDESALAAAERQVVASRTARDTAKQRREVDEASGRLSIENARQGLVTAQNNRDAATTDRPSTLAQQRAVVDGAVAAVHQAQQDVDDAVLTAPVDGVVSVLNGAVGEYVPASAGTSALAPGSAAAIPGTDTAGGTPAATAVARPGGTQFLVLDGADTFQVVVPFEESDAALIQPNQNVDVTFEAVPDLVRRGTVLAVAPGATASSGVVGYYVTVLLTETDPRLRDGQTAQAAVRTTELRDVPTVPNAAVRRDGGRTTVTVVGVDGAARTVPFQAGLVGDDRTQVLSGLTVGDEVLLPTGRAA